MDALLIPGVDLATSSGKAIAATGGLSFLVLGRWLLRAQAVASVLRMAGVFCILLGVAVVTGLIDVNGTTAVDHVGTLARLWRAIMGA